MNYRPKQTFTLLDGAMGTMLMAMGLQLNECAEVWNLNQPEMVQRVHQAYVAAGSQIILTNTLGANTKRLQTHQLEHKLIEINQKAVSLARTEATEGVLVAGSMGPGVDEAQVLALLGANVDILWLETMIDWQEMVTAVQLIRTVTDKPLAVTASFHGKFSPAELAHYGQENQLWACGANCGEGLIHMEQVIKEMHTTAPDLPLIAKSNAGYPNPLGRYHVTPHQFVTHVQHVQRFGATYIGGCCGIHSGHIQKAKVLCL